MKTLVAPGDAELAVVNYLTDLLGGVAVGVTLPRAWTRSAGPFVSVVCDGVLTDNWPVSTRCTVRVAVWHSTASAAKTLAGEAQGLLLAHPGGDGVARVLPGAGVFGAVDPDSQADLASFNVRVDMRTAPLSD